MDDIGFLLFVTCFGIAIVGIIRLCLFGKRKFLDIFIDMPQELPSKKEDPFKWLYKAFDLVIDQTPYRECDNFNTPAVVSQIKLDKILDNLEPLNKTNLKAESQKDDYWWKIQKNRNESANTEKEKWYKENENQGHAANELLGIDSYLVETIIEKGGNCNTVVYYPDDGDVLTSQD